MVRGLKKFSEYFTGLEGSYVLIGGAASHILEDEAQLVPRATKDLDLILVVESLSDAFVARFWSFIKEAGYEHIQKNTGKSEFYRFYKPADSSCPAQIELFSRVPDSIKVPEGVHLVPIPTGEDLSSLSAIMMNDEYYKYTVENSDLVQGVHIARSNALICLKAYAYLDMKDRLSQGDHVDSNDIAKHRNDIIRLGLTLTAEDTFTAPEGIRANLEKFFLEVANELPQDDFVERAGAAGVKVDAVINRIKEAFGL